MFAFIVSPIKAQKKSFICHVYFAETGVFNDITVNLINLLINTLEESGVDIVKCAYDGDAALSKKLLKIISIIFLPRGLTTTVILELSGLRNISSQLRYQLRTCHHSVLIRVRY